MSDRQSLRNTFLTAPPGRLFVANAVPMAVVMLMNGLQSVVDAVLLGRFVGTGAMAAVSMIFPVLMLMIALSTLVSGGMSSLYARHLGAGEMDSARGDFARAHGLALAISALLMLLYACAGPVLIRQMAGGAGDLAGMAQDYLVIAVVAAPIQFLLGLHADAMRNEGRAGVMAILSIGVTLINIVLSYLLIVPLGLGVAGSAWGTALAQGVGLMLLLALREASPVRLSALRRHAWIGGWGRIVQLGAPMSLSFLGLALGSALVILSLRLGAGQDYPRLVAAYGIATRIFGFAFLPLMALALACQSITGNNVGAGLYRRSDAVLRIAIGTALIYGIVVEMALMLAGFGIAGGFIADPAVAAETAAILRPMSALYLFTGPLLVLGLYFQGIGQPARAALLMLTKPFVILPAMILSVTLAGGVLWYAFPLADLAMLTIAGALLVSVGRSRVTGGFGMTGETA